MTESEFLPLTEDEALCEIVPSVVSLRFNLFIQMKAFGYTGPLTDVMLGETIFKLSDNINTAMVEWLHYYGGANDNWGRTYMDLIRLKTEKEINKLINAVSDRRMRAVLRCAVVCWHLHLAEELIQDGNAPTMEITPGMYKKMDDAFREFLRCWGDADNMWGGSDEDIDND